MDFGFTQEQQKLIDRVNQLVQERIAPRAAQYDQSFEAPIEDVQDLYDEGWLLANLDKRRGGLGYGLHGDDPLSFFLIDEHLAYGNPSTAHCFQVHNNALMMIDAMAADAQIQRWIEPTVKRGALIPGAGAEPLRKRADHGKARQRRLPGQRHKALRHQRKLGRVALDRPRRVGLAFAPIMFMMHKDTPGLKIDTDAWRPTGMRACVSPWLYLDRLFCAGRKPARQPGQFLGENWMGKINFAFTANYLGSARAMYDWALNYTRERGGGKDSYRQLRFGELKSMIDASRLILYNAVRMFKPDPDGSDGCRPRSKMAGQRNLGESYVERARKSAARPLYSSNIRWNVFTATCICT